MAGALDVKLTADTAQFQAEMGKAAAAAEREMQRTARASAFAQVVIKEMSKAQSAVGASSGEVTKASHAMEGFSFASAGAKRELLVLAHELSQGNYSKFGGSLMVLGERTGAAALLFSGLGVAILGAAAGLGGFVFAIIKGHAEQDAFNKSMVLTGNFAGQTASSFDALAESASKATGTTLGSGKDALQALVGTGRISQQAIEGATRATLNMERLTGQSAEEIAKDFGQMGEGVAKWAQKHNDQFHYLSIAQFKYIKQLEDQGKKEQAEVENFRLLNEHMGKVSTNLGTLEAAWKSIKEGAAAAWDAMKGVGKADTTAQQIANVQKVLEQKQQQGPLNDLTKEAHAKGIERLRQELYLLQEKARLENKSVEMQSKGAVADQKAIDKLMEKKKASGFDAWAGVDPAVVVRAQERSMARAKEYEQINRDVESAVLARYAADHKAVEEEIKLGAEQDKSFNKWFQDFDEKERARGMGSDEATNTAIGKYLRDIGDQTKAAEQLVSGAFSRMEDAIVNFAKTGKLSFKDLFGFMAEEYLRQSIRMAAKNMLLDEAGNSKVNWGSILSTVGDWFGSSASPKANGMSYVPNNGYPAILHEGERVMTRQENMRAGSGGSGVVIDNSGAVYNVGQGVSRGEVSAAVKGQAAETEARIRRLMRNGNI